MSYKHVLLGRHLAAMESRDEPAMLDYLDLRNRDSLRAWRQRYGAPPGFENRCRRRFWLMSLLRPESAR